MRGRLRALKALSADDQVRTKPLGLRLKKLLQFGFGQKRLLCAPEFWPGLVHIFIFGAFMVLLLRTLSLFAMGFSSELLALLINTEAPFWHTRPLCKAAYEAYLFLKDGVALAALVGVLYFTLWRLRRPPRLTASAKAFVVLGFIAALMLTEFLFGAGHMSAAIHKGEQEGALGATFTWVEPVTSGLAALLQMPSKAAFLVALVSFWLHLVLVLVFLNLLPRGKHFHVLLALPNVFFQRLPVQPQASASAALPTPNLEKEEFGVRAFSQLSWKQGLDLNSCTECGRCITHCPTHLTQKPLSHKGLNLALRAYLWRNEKALAEAAQTPKPAEGEATVEEARLVGELLTEETLWACTTCGFCEEACPVFIENIPRLIDMRRFQVQVEAQFPAELQRVFEGMERQGNPWGLGQETRDAWEGALALPKWEEGSRYDYLFYVGCAGSYDERMKKVSRAMAVLLGRAGLSFATLGKREMCTGDPARRAGNEYLFQTLAQANVETFNSLGVKAIITQCPHCYNTLKNEYPRFGGNYRVLSHAELLAELISEGKLELSASDIPKLTYHDPCYLGRHNRVYEAPRQVLAAIPGLEMVEMQRKKRESVCCGAGGSRMWMEEHIGERMNHHRTKEAIQTLEGGPPKTGEGTACVAVACPFCHTMLRDALSDLGKEEQLQVLDIAEVVAGALKRG